MRRFQAIQVIMDQIEDEIAVSNIGDPSKELYQIRDRAKNFYMLGSLGLASSISLGLALSQDRKVVCLDGDGSILMNMGSLSTIANTRPENLVLIVLDNGSYGSTGNQSTYSSGLTDLESVARACGIENCVKVEDEKTLSESIRQCMESNTLAFIHAIIEPDEIKLNKVPLDPIDIKNRFMKSVSS